LKKNLHQLEDATKDGFDQLVVATVKEYVKKKKLADEAKKTLIAILQAIWQEMEEEYLTDKDNDKNNKEKNNK